MPEQPTNQQLDQLTNALGSAFDHAELTRLAHSLEETLEWITPVRGDLQMITFELVQYFASKENGLKELLGAAVRERPLKIELVTLVVKWDDIEFAPRPLPADHPSVTNITNVKTEGGTYIEGNVAAQTVVGRDQIINNITQVAPEMEKPDYQTAYLTALSTECDALPLAELGGETGMGRDIGLGDVYIALDTTTQIKLTEEEKKAREEEGHSVDDDTTRPLKVQEAADRNAHLLLLGDPGSGKSTFVRQLVANNARLLLQGESRRLPIFVVLHELISELDSLTNDDAYLDARNREKQRLIVNLLAKQWTRRFEEWNIVEYEGELLAQARAAGEQILLVLDGLDEIPERLRKTLLDAIPAIEQTFAGIKQIIVTCRIRSHYDGMLSGYKTHTIADFTQSQVENFVAAWYKTQQALGRMSQSRAEQSIDELQTAARETLNELARNPMLLTTMTIIHQREKKLPDQRVELYKLAVEVLMNRWQQGKDQVANLSPELDALLANSRKLRPILERLAYEAHSTQAATPEPDDDNRGGQQPLRRGDLLVLLEELLDDNNQLANDFLEYIDHRAGLLVGRGGGQNSRGQDGGRQDSASRKPQTYSFPHRTFQEYLAGCYMNQGRSFARNYRDHLKEGDYWRVAAILGAEDFFYNKSNQNAVLDLAYSLCPVAEPTCAEEWRGVVWSAQIASRLEKDEIVKDDGDPDGGIKYLSRVLNRLVHLPNNNPLSITELAEAGQALGQLGDPRKGVGLKNGLPDIDWIPIDAGPFTMGTDPEVDKDGFSYEQPQMPKCNLITEGYSISRYPVTVAQYQKFILAGGYTESKYWTEAGWAWRESRQIDGPATFRKVFQTPNHPQVGVSWYEAIAFCRWLTDKLGIQITLPSEAQWERAARHTDGRIYPWTGVFDAQKCNSFETGIGHTTAVGFLPNGDAVCNASDIAGNVLEWTTTKWLDDYDQYESKVDNRLDGDATRVWRGGSCYADHQVVRCASRNHNNPSDRGPGLGFRLLAPSL